MANERSLVQSIRHFVTQVNGGRGRGQSGQQGPQGQEAGGDSNQRRRFFGWILLVVLVPLAVATVVLAAGSREKRHYLATLLVTSLAHIVWYVLNMGYRVWFTGAVAAALWSFAPPWLSLSSFVGISIVTAGLRAVLDDTALRAAGTLIVFAVLTFLFVVGTPLVARLLWFHPWSLRLRHAMTRRLTRSAGHVRKH